MARFDVVKEEENVLKYWKDKDIFKKSIIARQKGKPFVFYEGPPTANGKPGIHHIIARSYKDIILRYKTMRGFWVWRRAGWDTHGLPVELEVEKELGLKNKKDIEDYGIEKFNQKCKESVWRYKEDWEKLTERMGFWIDMDDPYITYDPDYIENLWAIFKKFSDKGLLFEDFKVVPYCVRCGTTISSHEVAQGYETVTDTSITVEFRVKGKKDTSLLAWTTTSWTLPGNIALAVNPDVTYVEIEKKDMGVGKKVRFILAKDRLTEIFSGDDYSIVKEYKGKDLVGLEYEPLFEVPELKSDKSHKIYSADFVSTDEGTGVVHTAVMYGIDDFELGTKEGLPKFHTVDENGRFVKSVPGVGGMPIVEDQQKSKQTEEKIIQYLKNKDLLFSISDHEHEYPFCWRCHSPLLYYARHSWFIGTNQKKKDLVRNNEKIDWRPGYMKSGRFGEWLRDVKDWAISRDRYWGTTIPVWRCEDKECGHTTVIGSLDELNKNRADKPTNIILMRHGEALSNKNGIISSWPETFDNHLTEKGIKQVEKSIKQLKKEDIDVIYASDLTRTKQTAEMVAKALGKEVNFDERLREVDTGEFNGRDHKEYYHFFAFLREKIFKAPSGGENWLDIRKRMWSFTKEIKEKHPGRNILIVSHGLPTILLDSTLKGLEVDELLKWEEKNELGTAEFRRVEFPNWPFNTEGEIDLHRPFVDEIKIKCSKCNQGMRRIPEVADAWFDSGAMPFAQSESRQKYTNPVKKPGLGEPLTGQFPADYISEAIDQTRGWFYTLHAISTLLGKGPSYKRVVTCGHVLDKKGKKMSKSLGNIVDPWEMMEKYGIDALRWYFFTVNALGEPKLFDEKDLKERYRKFIMTSANSLIFLETYWERTEKKVSISKEGVLDKWIRSYLDTVIVDVTKKLEDLDIVGAARLLGIFIDDVSNWYIRRSRSRLQNPDVTEERIVAQNDLWEVLHTFSRLIAPFTPFLGEIMFRKLVSLKNDNSLESVHLADWPKSTNAQDANLEKQMAIARNIASLGLADRAKVGIKVRQKLGALHINKKDFKNIKGLEELIKEEVNVQEVLMENNLGENEVKLDTNITPALEREGIFREIIRAVNDLRKESSLTPGDTINLFLNIKKPGGEKETFSDLEELLKKETRAKNILFKNEPHETLSAEREWKERSWELWVGIKKI